MKVLVAEDDTTSRMILGTILKKWGLIPVITSDGKQAWEIMKNTDAPKLAILDWQMPEMNGIEVCQKIRALNDPNPPYLIVLTSRDEKKDIVNALDAGANDFISKPYDNEELHARINVGIRMVHLQSELDEAYKALKYEAMQDPLTGIFNRRAIMKLLKKEMARAKRENTTIYIGLCDLDYFKKVNDTYGHHAGDDVLIAFTKLTMEKLRSSDHVGRYGGEEFLIVAPGPESSKPESMFERICEHVRNSIITTEASDVSITVSIGVAKFSGGESFDTLLAASDQALYQAKALGRDQVVFSKDI